MPELLTGPHVTGLRCVSVSPNGVKKGSSIPVMLTPLSRLTTMPFGVMAVIGYAVPLTPAVHHGDSTGLVSSWKRSNLPRTALQWQQRQDSSESHMVARQGKLIPNLIPDSAPVPLVVVPLTRMAPGPRLPFLADPVAAVAFSAVPFTTRPSSST